MAVKNKGTWVAILFILAGLVIGGLLGDLASNIDWLWWLSFGEEFGLQSPIVLDLSVVTITFALMIKINIASIVGVVVALLIYRKV
jgi:hypothetical protein